MNGTPPATPGARRILLLPDGVEPWASLLADHAWTLTGPGDEADVVVCLDEASTRTARRPADAVTIHLVALDAAWSGEGADTVLYDPSFDEFIDACERAVHTLRARRVAVEYVTDVLECIPDAFFILDWDWRVVYQNRAALASVAGREGGSGDILGDLLHEHVPDEVRDVLSPRAMADLRDGRPLQARVAVLARGATRTWIEANAYLIPSGAAVSLRDLAGAGVVGLQRPPPRADLAASIASLAERQRVLRVAFDRAVDAGQVTVGSARALLALLDETGDGLARVQDAAGEIGDLPRRPEAVIDLRETVRDALRLKHLTKAARARIQTRCSPTPPVRGEVEHVQALVVRLVQDAIDALGSHAGTIRVVTRAEPDLAVLVVEQDAPGLASEGGATAEAARRLAADLGAAMSVDATPQGGVATTVRFPARAESAS